MRYLLILFLCLAGCSKTVPSVTESSVKSIQKSLDPNRPQSEIDTESEAYSTSQQGRRITAQVDSFVSESDPWQRMFNAWNFVKENKNPKDEVTTDKPPMFLTMKLGEAATDWSIATGTRKKDSDADPGTLALTLPGFVFQLGWGPVLESHKFWTSKRLQDGKNDLLEWKFMDLSDEKNQKIELWFRMPAKAPEL
jgi:hypothetical protein